MPSVCREEDTAGGADLNASQTKVKANGKSIIVHGDSVDDHTYLSMPHTGITMIAGADMKVKIGGIKVCNSGDMATCGHLASSDSNVKIGD